jgi:hypothetical protein
LRKKKEDLAKLANHFLHTNQSVLNPYDAEIKQRVVKAHGMASLRMKAMENPTWDDYQVAFDECLGELYPNIEV